MKRMISLLAVVLALAASCGKDEIGSTDVTDSTGTVIDIDTTGSGTVSLDGYDRTLSVVFSTSGDATVEGATDSISVAISGNGVTITNGSSDKIIYQLSGSTADGYLKIYSGHKQALMLNGVSIANTAGAALNIQGPAANPGKGKATTVVLNGSSSLADGATYTATPATEDEKAALFCEGALILSGSGSLTVNATGKGAITSDTYLQVSGAPTINASATNGHGLRGKNHILISGGTIGVQVSGSMKKGLTSDTLVRIDGGQTTIAVTGDAGYDTEETAYAGSAGIRAGLSFIMNGGTVGITNSGRGGKGINGNGSATFAGGTLTVTVTGADYAASSDTVSAKGIKFKGNIAFAGSTVTVKCSNNEGIESKGAINVTAGEVYTYSAKDDAINSKGDFTVSGGYLCAHSAGNDGIDANGNCYIDGGVVYAISTKGEPEVAIDANSEENKKLYVRGGTLIAVGGLESGASLEQTCYQASSWSKGAWYLLTVGDASYAFKTPTGGSSLVVSGASAPTLQSASTPSGGTSHFDGTLVENGTTTGGATVGLTQYTASSSGPGGGPHH